VHTFCSQAQFLPISDRNSLGGPTSSGMLHGAVSILLPTSNQRHTTPLNSEDLSGTAAEALSLVGLFLHRQIPECRVHKKNYTNIKNYISQPFSMRLDVLTVDDEGSSCLWCDTARTDNIPIHQLYIVLYVSWSLNSGTDFFSGKLHT